MTDTISDILEIVPLLEKSIARIEPLISNYVYTLIQFADDQASIVISRDILLLTDVAQVYKTLSRASYIF